MTKAEPLAANIPEGFNRNLAELPLEFVQMLGLFWLFAPRFDWCLGVAVSQWSRHDDPARLWPAEKNSKLIARLLEIVRNSSALGSAKAHTEELLKEAVILNGARNDLAHSFILAHGPNGELFVQKVRVLNNSRDLVLQEGAMWTMSDVEGATLRLASWCKEFELVLANTMDAAG